MKFDKEFVKNVIKLYNLRMSGNIFQYFISLIILFSTIFPFGSRQLCASSHALLAPPYRGLLPRECSCSAAALGDDASSGLLLLGVGDQTTLP